jgi:hypothetical protein
MTTARLIALACLTAVFALVAAGPAAAQFPTKLIVAVSDSPDPAASGGKVAYAVTVRVEGSTKAHDVVVTIPVPADTVFDKCTMVRTEGAASTPCTPGLADGVVTASLGHVPAWKTPRVTLTLTMPAVAAAKEVTLTADADSTDATDDKNSATTTVLPPNTFVTYLPSGRIGPTGCGDTLSPERFGTDTTARLNQGLGCSSTSAPYGLKITASGKTLDLNQFKIVGAAALGNVGILVSNAKNVTIVGGSTGGASGIEYFDWCVKDEGKSVRLIVTNLRCFRARTAGIDIKSKKASITAVRVDSAVGTATTTAELPGGVGIRTRGDETKIKDSTIRRVGAIGILVDGTDVNGNGRVASIEGDKASCSTTLGSKMRIEASRAGIGLLLDGGPHFVKNVCVKNLYNDREDPPIEGDNGVVVGLTGLNNLLDGVVVKQYGGNAFVVDGTGTTITNSNVDLVGLDGFVVTGAGSTLSDNGVQNARHGFIVTGLDTDLDTNETEDLDGDGFVVDGDTPVLTTNSAQGNAGRGFVIGGASGLLDSNTAENNIADGFIVTGSGNTLKTNNSKKNGGTGYTVSGSDNHLDSNSAELNVSYEWVIFANNFDGGGNTRGSGFPAISFTSDGITTPN